jgi:NAD(P)-dependent dehydrogenase (short-subunit alcohol dehydrogenase family)
MRLAWGGRIVNIGAVYGRYPDPAFIGTSVNRAAGNSFTKTLALELAKHGIVVNGVNIGYVVTPRSGTTSTGGAHPKLPRDEFLAELAAQEVPLGRFGTPEEVSGIVARYITGASIDVAGGMGKYV